jgi:hypothetical protein
MMLVAVIRETAIEPSALGLRNVFGRPHRATHAIQTEELTASEVLDVEPIAAPAANEPNKKTGTADL